jgi:hypothetical protein
MADAIIPSLRLGRRRQSVSRRRGLRSSRSERAACTFCVFGGAYSCPTCALAQLTLSKGSLHHGRKVHTGRHRGSLLSGVSTVKMLGLAAHYTRLRSLGKTAKLRGKRHAEAHQKWG